MNITGLMMNRIIQSPNIGWLNHLKSSKLATSTEFNEFNKSVKSKKQMAKSKNLEIDLWTNTSLAELFQFPIGDVSKPILLYLGGWTSIYQLFGVH